MVHSFNAVQKLPSMCCCVPLRMGVFLNALATVVLSFVGLVMHNSLHILHTFMGGYDLKSRVVVGAMECVGLVWGWVGVIGAWRNDAHYVRIFNYYQMFRIVVWIGMYFIDVPIMWNCELWITDINGALKQQGWNPLMYNIAMGGNCRRERISFFVGSTLCFFIFVYCWEAVSRFINDLEYEPRYLLRVPKEIPSGSFFAETVMEGERTLLAPELPEKPAQLLWQAPRPGVPGMEIKPGALLRTPHGTFPSSQQVPMMGPSPQLRTPHATFPNLPQQARTSSVQQLPV